MIKEKANEINITVLNNLLDNKNADEKIAFDNFIKYIEKKITQSKYITYTGEVCNENNIKLI
ncbi:MAG: hypothetical protein K2F59_03975, partial [Eubacteriales bacterium]|nr:hypothetical protein [Eubacteriales bacterium]